MEKDYEYIGLFLTKRSKALLNYWLSHKCPEIVYEKYDWDKVTMYLDHCTLLHKSQHNPVLEERLLNLIDYMRDTASVTITDIGYSNKALAFKVDLTAFICANKIPHITICTFNGGKPADSNNITEWVEIKPIKVAVYFKKV
jgi:hypothetical protein